MTWKSFYGKIASLSIFSIAMGFMEAVIVVYLRKLYYPGGFQFPLAPMEESIAGMEFCREAATIIMLVAVGILSFSKASQRFAGFLFCFGIWDLCYYLFLKLLINWPESFLTPDILFLIPVPWVGLVLAPCITAFSMVLLAFVILFYAENGCPTRVNSNDWLFVISGSLVVILSFLMDFLFTMNQTKTANLYYLHLCESCHR